MTDINRNIALRVLKDKLNITPKELTRFTTGYCHSVYYVKAESGEFVDPAVCDTVADLATNLSNYFKTIRPTAYLDDISTKNVLIYNGKLAGIVDIDEMGYGDPLEVVGFMNMALLAMRADTNYIDYWLDELQATVAQRKAVIFYTLLSCVGFMGERGAAFDNGTVVPVDQDEVILLNEIYRKQLYLIYCKQQA